MSISKLTLQQIASELSLCNRIAFCWSSSTSSTLFTQKLSSYLSSSSSSVCRVGETLLIFIHNNHNCNNSNNDLTILLSFIHSLSSSSSTSPKIQFAFIDLQLTKQQRQRNDDVDIFFNDDKSLFSDLIKIQMIIDPIYSSTIHLPRQHDEEKNIYSNIDETAHDHGNTNNNTNNNNNNIFKMSHLVVPEEIIVLMMTRGQKANVETLLLDFFTTSLSSSSNSIVRWRRLFAEKNEEDNNNSTKIHSSSKKRTEVLISRYCELFEIKDDESNKQSSTSSSMGNWQSTAVSNDERKWSVFVTQKMLSSSSSSGLKTKNDNSIHHGENTNNDDNHENYFQGLSQHQVKTAAPALLSLFCNPVKISMHYERMLHDASNTIIDRRKQHASPLRKVMKYLSPVSSNHHEDGGASSRIEIETNENRNDNNADDDGNDDETEAILRALTEKKKSMTLAKKAEEWFAELSSRGVPAPLKGLAMSLSYQYRFWLTPMGFLVIGSCLMLLMGVGLLFI